MIAHGPHRLRLVLSSARATGAARRAGLWESSQMGSPKVLARATGSAAERACSSKGVLPHSWAADRPLAGAPSRFGPAQRTQAFGGEGNPPTPQIPAGDAAGRSSDWSRAPHTPPREHFVNPCKTRLATLRALPQLKSAAASRVRLQASCKKSDTSIIERCDAAADSQSIGCGSTQQWQSPSLSS